MNQPVSTGELVGRVFGSLLESLDLLSIYVGDRLGYYRSLAEHGGSTSQEVADRTGNSERYVREWLEQQAVTGFLTVDDPSAPAGLRRYSLADTHAEVFLDESSLAFLVPAVRMLVAAAGQIQGVLDAHRTGGGVGWDNFGPDMREGQAALNRPYFENLLGTEWFPAVPELDMRLRSGARVADIGTGFGWSAMAMAKAYPGARIQGFDLDAPSIAAANRAAADRGLSDRVEFHTGDAGKANVDGHFDVVTAFECIHDMGDPVTVLTMMRRLAGEDGYVVVMDERVAPQFGATDDVERLMYGFSNFVCLPDGMSHPGSVGTGTVMRPGTLKGYAQAAGFSGIEILPIEADFWRFYRLVQ